MEPRAMAAMVAKLFTIDAESLAALSKIEIQKTGSAMKVEGGVATINIHGILMKNPPSWLAWLGIELTDYNQVRRQLAEAAGNTNVQSITLHIDSPGGTVAGASEAAEAIKSAGQVKPVNAYIEDLGASGAYYLASQAKQIAANLNAEVGSIGVYTVCEDWSKAAEMAGVKVDVIRSGEHKGMGVIGAPITEEQKAAVRDVVNGMAANFKSAVVSGRGMTPEAVEVLADGRVFIAAEAKKNGLIDSVIMCNPDEDKDKENKTMAETKTETNDTAVEPKKATVAELKAAFPDEPAFVLEQFEKEATVEQAKATFADVMKVRNTELKQQNAELKKNKKSAGGAPPVPAGGEGGNQVSGGFLELAEQYAEEHKCSKTIAMKKVKKDNPAIFNTYINSCRKNRVKGEEE